MKDNLAEWLTHIESFHPSEIELGLDRIRAVAIKLALLKPAAKVILVAGTNGKGSCVSMLESLALNQNKNIATYTSPHLLEFNERIRINGKNIDDLSLVEAFNKIESVRGETRLTFFEFTTLAALYCFSKATLDLIVLEIGLGGRQDATNIIDPNACIITTVDKDHIDWLGDDLDKIAYEKGGIIRATKPTFVGDLKTLRLLNKVLPELSNETCLIEFNDDPNFSDPEVNQYRLHQQNVILAKCAFESVFNSRLNQLAIYTALKAVSLSGRFQKLTLPASNQNSLADTNIQLIIDVAHNVQSAKNLSKQLSDYKQLHKLHHITAICGMMADKAIDQVINELAPNIDHWCFVDLQLPRAIKANQLQQHYVNNNNKAPSLCFESVAQAYEFIDAAGGNISTDNRRLILVFGSFITVANMLQYANSLNKS
jgi:dihydrofolate synthase / folylpolyglutamate synthase